MRHSPWVLDGDGCPLVPSSVLAELQELDPRLGLQYHKGMHAFVVTYAWAEDDPRREMIRRGDIGNTPWSIEFPVPTDISLDELRGWLAGALRRVASNNADLRRSIEAEEARLRKQNEAISEQKFAEAREELAMAAEQKTINVGTRRTRVK